jgi:hypothetical protein
MEVQSVELQDCRHNLNQHYLQPQLHHQQQSQQGVVVKVGGNFVSPLLSAQ